MKDKRFNLGYFNSTFPKQYFDSLKQLTNICKNVFHSHNDNETISSEGIYIFTTSGHYIELLNRIGDLKM